MKKYLAVFAVVFGLSYFKYGIIVSTSMLYGAYAVAGLFVLLFVLSFTPVGRVLRIRNPLTGRRRPKKARKKSKDSVKDDSPALIYVITNRRFDAIKVGIGDDTERRLNDHRSEGWKINKVYRNMDRGTAYDVEQAILRKWRARGWDCYMSPDDMPQGGYTETASLRDASLEETCELVEKLLGRKSRRSRFWF